MKRNAMAQDELKLISQLSAVLHRGAREYGLGVYLMLAVVAARGEVSSRALDRIMGKAGYKNARQYRHVAQTERPRLIQYREDKDGKWWSITDAGREVLARLMRRIAGASKLAAKLERAARGKRTKAGEDGQMMLGLFDEEGKDG